MAQNLNQDGLEAYVDQFGLANVLTMLQSICELKAEHVRENWQDRTLGKMWDIAQDVLEKPIRQVKDIGFASVMSHDPEKFNPRNSTG